MTTSSVNDATSNYRNKSYKLALDVLIGRQDEHIEGHVQPWGYALV